MLFYKATTAGNKGGIVAAKGNGPVDGRRSRRTMGMNHTSTPVFGADRLRI